jgi:hypothetical protein
MNVECIANKVFQMEKFHRSGTKFHRKYLWASSFFNGILNFFVDVFKNS